MICHGPLRSVLVIIRHEAKSGYSLGGSSDATARCQYCSHLLAKPAVIAGVNSAFSGVCHGLCVCPSVRLCVCLSLRLRPNISALGLGLRPQNSGLGLGLGLVFAGLGLECCGFGLAGQVLALALAVS